MIWIPGKQPPPNPPSYEIDWLRYINITSVTLKDAIALSCGIDPRAVYSTNRDLVFSHRLTQAIADLKSRSSTIKVVTDHANIELSEISLSSLLSFARKNTWSIPGEFELIRNSMNNTQQHRLGNKRTHPMHHPLDAAYKETCAPKTNTKVWAKLRDMASCSSPLSPLLEFKERNGNLAAAILYENEEGKDQRFTHKNFIDMIARYRKQIE